MTADSPKVQEARKALAQSLDGRGFGTGKAFAIERLCRAILAESQKPREVAPNECIWCFELTTHKPDCRCVVDGGVAPGTPVDARVRPEPREAGPAEKCPECKGDRVIWPAVEAGFSRKCPTCHGSGLAPRPERTGEGFPRKRGVASEFSPEFLARGAPRADGETTAGGSGELDATRFGPDFERRAVDADRDGKRLAGEVQPSATDAKEGNDEREGQASEEKAPRATVADHGKLRDVDVGLRVSVSPAADATARRCPRCGGRLAHPAQIYCGAACSAESEMGAVAPAASKAPEALCVCGHAAYAHDLNASGRNVCFALIRGGPDALCACDLYTPVPAEAKEPERSGRHLSVSERDWTIARLTRWVTVRPSTGEVLETIAALRELQAKEPPGGTGMGDELLRLFRGYEFPARACGDRKVLKLTAEQGVEVAGSLLRNCLSDLGNDPETFDAVQLASAIAGLIEAKEAPSAPCLTCGKCPCYEHERVTVEGTGPSDAIEPSPFELATIRYKAEKGHSSSEKELAGNYALYTRGRSDQAKASEAEIAALRALVAWLRTSWPIDPGMIADRLLQLDAEIAKGRKPQAVSHHCHALGCKAYCPPAWLMCKAHWRRVPPDLANEVYRTVKLRGESIDHTWAPWWRAQARAIAYVAFLEHPDEAKRDAYLAREMSTADLMERDRDELSKSASERGAKG